MKFNEHEFFTGETFNAWEYFGAHVSPSGTQFRVFAPHAKDVAVIGEFSDWEPIPMQKSESGIYSAKVKNAKAGQMYKYRIYFFDGNFCDHADPYAFSSELRPGTASVIADLSYKFKDKKWMDSRDLNYNKPMNIYEVHLGSWKTHDDGSFFTYSEIAEELTQYALDHHYTHVEFMPLTEYPADASWGYQVLGFYSATSRYGSPTELMQLIDTLHQNGIGVILDFVPVHFALDYFGLAWFDGEALYEYPHDDTGYSEWGSKNFNYYRGEVRSFLQSSADFWVEKYHVDGLRMDAISNVIYWQGNRDRGVNEGAVQFVQFMNQGLKKRFPNVMKIAEDSSSYIKVTAPVEYDGLGFDYKWDMGWMHDTLDFFKFDKYDRGGYIAKIQWSMYYFYNELFLLPLSHDEVVHGKASIVNKMNGSYEEKFEQAKLLYLYMMTHPGKKLNFMGNEFAQFAEWTEEHQLDWMLLDYYPIHYDFAEYITNLNKFYMDHPVLWENDYNSHDFKWWNTSRLEVLAFERKADKGNKKLITIMNFGGHDLKDIKVNYDKKATLKPVFKSLNHIYTGTIETSEDSHSYQNNGEIGDYAFLLDLPPFGGIVMEVTDIEEEKPAPKKTTKKKASSKITTIKRTKA